jgi:hypothetical protein
MKVPDPPCRHQPDEAKRERLSPLSRMQIVSLIDLQFLVASGLVPFPMIMTQVVCRGSEIPINTRPNSTDNSVSSPSWMFVPRQLSRRLSPTIPACESQQPPNPVHERDPITSDISLLPPSSSRTDANHLPQFCPERRSDSMKRENLS